MKKIYCVGINDYNGKVNINNKKIKSYQIWQNMLRRCYNKNFQDRHPTYVGVAVCDEWLKFSKFKDWFDKNYRYDLEEQGIKLHIDKDLLSRDGKVYSPDTCVFLPSNVNKFLSNSYSNNKSGYIGVSWDNSRSKWKVQINEFNSSSYKNIGRFKNIEDARNTYIKARHIEAEKCREYLRELGYNENIVNKIK